MRRRPRSTAPQHRLGFTLIELLVVIVILGLLVGLLVPAVMRAVGTAKEAAAASEIRALSQALADFKAKYGDYPPSRIIVSEDGDFSSLGILGRRSATYLRKFWPRVQIGTSGAPAIPGIGFYDFDGNGKKVPLSYTLSGPECLVFFLGGLPQQSAGGWGMTGFSKNPVNPFENSLVTTNRTVPLFEFDGSRLEVNKSNKSVFPGYLDSLGRSPDPDFQPFYCYFSAYGGAGYDPGDVDFTSGFEERDDNGVVMTGAFKTANSAPLTGAVSAVLASPSPNPYTNDPPVPTKALGAYDPDSTKYPVWQNAQTFQIISAGRDRRFGIGGQYLANGNDKLPFIAGTSAYLPNSFQTKDANGDVTGLSLGNDARTAERDNVTNFSAGKLD